jgi:hypothetical protein
MPGKKKTEILKISILVTAAAVDIFIVSGPKYGKHWSLTRAPRGIRTSIKALLKAVRKKPKEE